MARDVYTADMGQPPSNDDMMSIEDVQIRGKRKAPRIDLDANIYTADKGMPPSPDEGPTAPVRPKTDRQKKAAKDIKTAMGMKKGGKVSSASKRADGCATKGKTKGRFV